MKAISLLVISTLMSSEESLITLNKIRVSITLSTNDKYCYKGIKYCKFKQKGNKTTWKKDHSKRYIK